MSDDDQLPQLQSLDGVTLAGDGAITSDDVGGDDDNATALLAGSDDTMRIVVPAVFVLIFVVGVIGNGLLVFSTLANAVLRTTPNILICSLAVGDFVLICVSVPFTGLLYLLGEWTLGSAACKANFFLQTASLAVSIFTLAALRWASSAEWSFRLSLEAHCRLCSIL